MKNLTGRIEELEMKAAESALIADLATDRDARIANSRLAEKLREAVGELRRRQRLQPTINDVVPGRIRR